MRKAGHKNNLLVCDYCLQEIKAHGEKPTIKNIFYYDDNGVCDWCEDPQNDKLNELL